MADLSRRSLLALAGLGAVGTAAVVAAADRARHPRARRRRAQRRDPRHRAGRRGPRSSLVAAFNRGAPRHPGAGAGHPGRRLEQLLRQDPDPGRGGHAAGRLLRGHRGRAAVRRAARRSRWTSTSGATPAELQDYFDDVHPSLIEAFMYQGSLFQLPLDFNAANVYYNTERAANAPDCERPADDWTKDDFLDVLRGHARRAAPRQLPPVLLDQPAVGRRRAVALRQRHQLPGRVEGDRRRLALGPVLRRRPDVGAARRRLPVARAQRRRPRVVEESFEYLRADGRGGAGLQPGAGRRQRAGGPVRRGRDRHDARRRLLGRRASTRAGWAEATST